MTRATFEKTYEAHCLVASNGVGAHASAVRLVGRPAAEVLLVAHYRRKLEGSGLSEVEAKLAIFEILADAKIIR